MEAVRFSFNDFDLVIYAFDFPCMDLNRCTKRIVF
jgi:hypothetical protein